MPGRHDQHHVILHEGLNADVAALLGAFNKRHADLPRHKQLQHGIGVAASGGEAHPGLLGEKAGHQVRQQVLADCLRGAEREFPGLFAVRLRHRDECVFAKHPNRLSEGQQGLAAGRERDAAPAAMEERHTEFILERFDLLGDSRLGEQELLSRAAEVEMVRHGTEDAHAKVFDH